MPAAIRWFLTLLILNPICVRLVQNGSRRKRHLYIRSGYLAMLIVVLMLLLLPTGGAQSYRELAAEGARAFEYVAYLQLLLIVVLTPVFMAGAIAQESNPRTWDVLLTTPLSATQIVLGNLFGRLFFVIGLLFASLPLFAITQYFGGVPGSSVLASYAVSACAALLVGAVAVALSVNRLAGRRAVFTFYIAVISYIGVTLALDLAIRGGSPSGPGGVTVLTPTNPFLALYALLAPSSYPTPDDVTLAQMGALARFWFGSPVTAFCTVSSGLAAALALGSSISARSVSASSGAAWYRKLFGVGARGADTRPAREVWHNPIAWREAAARAATLPKILIRWAFILAGTAVGIGLTVLLATGTLSVDEFQLAFSAALMIELVVITLIAINMSATAISREREDGTLDLLLTTPLSQTAYLNGKLRGLISYLLPLLAVPVVTAAAASAYVLTGGFGSSVGATVQRSPMYLNRPIDVPIVLPEGALLLPLAVVPFLAFVIMLGLQWSLKSKGTISSVVATVALVGLIAGVVGLCAYSASDQIPVAGPALSALNPVNLVFALVSPLNAFAATVEGSGLGTARVAFAFGAGLSVVINAALVFSLRAAMVRTFDQTTRKLAGSR